MGRMAPSYDKKTVLVTGGAGFIGSHLCESLARRAHVICVDNFSTGTPAHIQALLQQPNFELLRHDVNEPLDLDAQRELDRFQLRVHGIQEIYHLASPVAKHASDRYRLATLQTHSTGFRHILELAARYKAKVLLTSSSTLYEPTSEPYVAEDARCWDDHLLPSSVYDEAHRFAETMLQAYSDVHQFPAKIVRVFPAYGPRLRAGEGFLLPDLIRAALAHEDLELAQSEDARLNLCFVTDLVDGLVKAMEHPHELRVLNLGSDQEVRLGTVVSHILQLTGSTSHIRFRAQESVAHAPLPNIHKARQLLHWLPLVRLDEGLKRMIDYARSKHQEVGDFSL